MKIKSTENIKLLSVITIGATVLTKVLGLLREMMISGALGATVESDAYNIAYLLVITVFGLFSAAYSNSLVPTAANLYLNNKKKLNSTVSAIMTLSLLFALVLVGAMHLFPKVFVLLLASRAETGTLELAAKLIKISSWSLVMLTVASALGVILIMFDKNIAPSLAGMVFPLPVLVLLLGGCTKANILITGVVVGYIIQVLVLYAFVLQTSFRYKPNFQWKNQYVFDFFALMPPMLVSSGLIQINTLVDNQVASGFGVGSVTALQQASKVNSLAYTVFSTALMQIIYAKLTKSFASGDKEGFQNMVKQQVKLILMFIVPCSIILPMYGEEIIKMLFLRGNYTLQAAAVAGSILRGYGIGLVFYVLRDIMLYIYYSAQNSKFPSAVNSIAVGLNIILNIVLSGVIGIQGIAYATSLSAIAAYAVLRISLKRKIMSIKIIERMDLYKIIISGCISCVVLHFLKRLFSGMNVWVNVLAFAAGFLTYWGSMWILDKKMQDS